MKNSPKRPSTDLSGLVSRLATGRGGRLFAFSIDLAAATINYWRARVQGKQAL